MAMAWATLWPVVASGEAIGTWKAYPAYDEVEQIEVAGDMVYAVSEGSLFAYNAADGSVETFSKMDLLNDCSVSRIKWCPVPKRLMVLYGNGDIDFLSPGGDTENLAAYQNHSSAVDKTVNSLTPSGNMVYMATNFGVVKINAKESYVADTYSLGCKVYAVAETGGYIYAATEEGLKRGATADNLLDPAVWQAVGTTRFTHLAVLQGRLVGAMLGSCCWISSDGDATEFLQPYYDGLSCDGERMVFYGGNYTSVVVSPSSYFVLHENHAVVAHQSGDTYYTVAADGSLARINMQEGQLPSVTELTGIRPDGPRSPHFGFLKYKDGKLLCGTGVNESVDGAVQILSDGEWQVLPDDMEESTGASYKMTFAVDEDPAEEGHIMVGAQSGLYEFRAGAFVRRYGADNSPLQPASTVSTNRQNYVVVPGVLYADDGTLWLTNGQSATTSLFSLGADGSFTSHHHSEFMTTEGWSMFHLGCMMTDSRDLIWMVNNNYYTGALVCYNPQTDEARAYKSIVNQDGTALENWSVRCVAEDTEGNIWAGTDKGIVMLTASDISSGSDTFTQPKIPRDDDSGLADYLLSGEDVTAIAIDKANRKWVGTNGGGLYVISPDNMEELHHFTASGSSLLSDYIESVAINPSTGEVFVGTTYGLCSYMSDISVMPDEMDKSTVWAYPNPVEPDYSGKVTICGLSYGTDVKICTSAGTLVAEGTSAGGTFEWDCRDRQGRRVASGVYMVHTAEADGSAGCVCKIAVVN